MADENRSAGTGAEQGQTIYTVPVQRIRKTKGCWSMPTM